MTGISLLCADKSFQRSCRPLCVTTASPLEKPSFPFFLWSVTPKCICLPSEKWKDQWTFLQVMGLQCCAWTLKQILILQVRYAACVCARTFLLSCGEFRTRYYPGLLPHLCFNRYDAAEGVRYYSMETWKSLMGTTGPQMVAQHVNEVLKCK